MTAQDAIHALWTASIATPIDLKANGARDIAVALNLSLAGIFALYLKTKSYHRHMSGAHFRDSHLRRSHHKLIYLNEVDGGGHFAAWEQPELFSTGIRAAFRSLRQST
jgi:pimeloyl-ACP methyl ester carboxylesterase